MKTKTQKCSLVMLMLFACLCAVIFFSANSINVYAIESTNQSLITENADENFDFNSPQVQQLCKELTSSDNIENEGLTIGEFIANVKAGYYYEIDSYRQTEILQKIIPINTVFNPGKYFYAGDEYAFYVRGSWEIIYLTLIDYTVDFTSSKEIATLETNILNVGIKPNAELGCCTIGQTVQYGWLYN